MTERAVLLTREDVIPLHLADVTFPESHPLAGQQGVVYGFAVRHPDGVVLVDTGVGAGNSGIDAAYTPQRWDIANAFRQQGIDHRAVVCVINTHLHFDHCGGNALFPHVPIYVQRREFVASQEPRYTVTTWVDFPEANYQLLDGESEVLPGIHVISTPGHTTGHQSVVLATREGPIVLAGQAIYSSREYEHIRTTGSLLPDDPPPDAQAYLASALRLIDLDPRHVFFGHDRSVWRKGSRE